MPIVICYQDEREIIQDIDPDLAKQLFENTKNNPKNASHADQMKSTLITTEIEGKMVQTQEFKFPTKDSRDFFMIKALFEMGKGKKSGNGQANPQHQDEVSEDTFIVSHKGQHHTIQNFNRRTAEKIFNQLKDQPSSANIRSQMQSKLLPSPIKGVSIQQFNFPTEGSRDLFLKLVNTQKSIEASTAMSKQLNELKSSETTDSETPAHRIK